MRIRAGVLALFLTLTILSASCGGGALSGPSSVMGGVWKLESLETQAGLVGISQPSNYTAEFREASAFSAKADCNACSGKYSISGDTLQIGPLGCTRAFCGSASNDNAFLDILTNASRFGVRGTELSIESPRGVARFSR